MHISTSCRTLQYITSLITNQTYIYVLPGGPDQQQSIYDPGGDVLNISGTVTLDGRHGE